jgi:hypothetical protein
LVLVVQPLQTAVLVAEDTTLETVEVAQLLQEQHTQEETVLALMLVAVAALVS